MNAKFKNLLFILLLGSVSAASLIQIQGYTLPKIQRYHELQLKGTILQAAGLDYKDARVEKAFDENIREIKKGGLTYYLSPDNLYIFVFEGRGLWGMIKGVISLGRDLKTIENLRIISQEETPGLGGRITEEGFLSQFKKKKVFPRLFLALRTRAVRVNEVDAITGASMTSMALIDMINESVIDFRKKVGK